MKNLLGIIVSFILGVIFGLALFWLSGKIEARTVCCLCHNWIHNPHQVCSDCNSYKQGHELHLLSGFDKLGICPIPTLPPIPTIPEPTCDPTLTPTPIDSPTPTPIITEEPKQEARGGGSSEVYSPPEYHSSVCSVSLPAKPYFTYSRISPTEVKVMWNFNDENTTHISLSWGYEKDNLPYGALNIDKNTHEFVIGALEPNKTIWVEMGRWNTNDCVTYSDRIDP